MGYPCSLEGFRKWIIDVLCTLLELFLFQLETQVNRDRIEEDLRRKTKIPEVQRLVDYKELSLTS